MNRLTGKVAVITGGNSGVGAAAAKLFAAEGAKVVISARRAAALDEVAGEIKAAGGAALAVPADISKPEDVKRLIQKTVETFGKLDILVNNAGILDKNLNAIDRVDYEDLDRVLAINEKGTVYCLREALTVLQEGASIVNIASVAGVNGGGGAAYVASKAALIGVTKHTAMRFAKQKIRCNAVCPGSIITPMTTSIDRAAMDMSMMDAMRAHSDLSVQPCQPEDVANVALFLASDESRALTGQILVPDFGANL